MAIGSQLNYLEVDFKTRDVLSHPSLRSAIKERVESDLLPRSLAPELVEIIWLEMLVELLHDLSAERCVHAIVALCVDICAQFFLPRVGFSAGWPLLHGGRR